MAQGQIVHATSGSSLGDILERILDKGVVIAGDISIALCDVELLTIRIRLVVASVDKAMEMGIDWWKSDPMLSSHSKQLEAENMLLKERLEKLEEKVGN